VSDDAPTFAQPAIPIYKAAGFVPISIEALQDEQNVAQEVGKLLAQRQGRPRGRRVHHRHRFGSAHRHRDRSGGVDRPSVVNSATTDTFALADVYACRARCRPATAATPSWLANNLIYNRIRQFDTSGGAGLWARSADGRPDRLLGRPVLEAESMDGVITTSGGELLAVFGDFSNYVIADRVG
jgi:HK97 family phage major capsid protein